MSYVPVPPAETTSPPTAACAAARARPSPSAVLRLAFGAVGEPDHVALVAHDAADVEAACRARDRRARRPRPARQPQRGMPTFTSTSTSRMPFAAAASIVASESTATVTPRAGVRHARGARGRPSRWRAAGRHRGRRAARPTISLGVAHVKPVWPRAAWARASAVHLCAFTCGRSARPGSAAAIVARLCASAVASTTSAGVGRSATRIARGWHVSPTPAEARPPTDRDWHTDELPPTPQRDFLIPAERWVEAPAELRSSGAISGSSWWRTSGGSGAASCGARARRRGPTRATWRSRPTTSTSGGRSACLPTDPAPASAPTVRPHPLPDVEGGVA